MNRSAKRNRNEVPTDLSNETPDPASQATRANSHRNTDKTLKLMYGVACFANLIINLDHGIIPACTQELMADLGINELNLGTLGSVVYVGLLLGSISSGPLLQSYSSKKIIAGCTLGNILSVLIFPLTKNFFLLCVSRCLVGFFQVFLVIYFPVWVDLHGKERKTMWITFLQIGVAFGVVLGYVLTAISVKFFNWTVPFYTQILLLAPCFVAFCLFDDDLMSTNSKNVKEAELASDEEEGHERYLLTISHSGSFFGNEVRDYILGGEAKQSVKKDGLEVGGDEDENITDKLSYVDYIRILWSKKVYIYTMLAISSLYFVITGIQFWISDYMRTVLRQEKGTVFVAFAAISTVGPVLGVAVGGKLMDRLGGYTSKQALDFCLFCGVMASLSGMPVPFLSNFTVICALLFILLFFGGALMPAVIGIMLSSIPKKMKAIGYSTAYIVQNFLGYVPAPLAYGTVMRLTGGEESRFGMVLLMAWSTLGVFALFAAKNARIQKHMDYMKMQYVEIGDEEVHRPDLFEPKPKNIELKAMIPAEAFEEEDVYDPDAPKKVRHARTRTFIPPDVLVKRRSTVYKPGRVEKELEALGASTVDYQMLRQSRTGILSKENLGDMSLMFGRGGIDKPKRTKDEML